MKYFVMWGGGSSVAQVKEFDDQHEMLECVREHHNTFQYLPDVYYGEKIDFEPAEIVKSWKVNPL